MVSDPGQSELSLRLRLRGRQLFQHQRSLQFRSVRRRYHLGFCRHRHDRGVLHVYRQLACGLGFREQFPSWCAGHANIWPGRCVCGPTALVRPAYGSGRNRRVQHAPDAEQRTERTLSKSNQRFRRPGARGVDGRPHPPASSAGAGIGVDGQDGFERGPFELDCFSRFSAWLLCLPRTKCDRTIHAFDEFAGQWDEFFRSADFLPGDLRLRFHPHLHLHAAGHKIGEHLERYLFQPEPGCLCDRQ